MKIKGMGLQLSELVAEKMVLPHEHKAQVHKFRQMEQCLMSLFWTVHNRVDNGEKLVLIMDKTEDLEKFNYLLSKYGLNHSTLIVTETNNFDVSHMLAKFRNDHQRKNELIAQQEAFNTTSLQLEDFLVAARQEYNKLHTKTVFPKSVVQINDMIYNNKSTRIDTSANILRPPYSYSDYQAKKATFEKAEKIYDVRYKHFRSSNPFNEATIREVEKASLVSILIEMRNKANNILTRYEDFEAKITETLSSKFEAFIDKIKSDIAQVNLMLTKSSKLSETEVIKQLYFQKELYESLEINLVPPTDESGLKDGFERIKSAAEHKLNSCFTKVQGETSDFLARLTPSNNSYPEVKPLIEAVNQFTAELMNLDLFVETSSKQSIAISFQKQNLLDLKEKLDYALYFIQEHEGYLAWLLFEKGLSHEDKTIIEYLAKQQGFWSQEFETLFLEYYLNHTKLSLNSYQAQNRTLDNLLADFCKNYFVDLLNRSHNKDVLIKNIETDNWAAFLEDDVTNLIAQYPLMIVSSDFYRKHSSRLASSIDTFLFLNEMPRQLIEEDWLSYTFIGYSPYFYDLANSLVDLVPVQQELNQAYFNVNRDFSNLSLSELNRGAAYLGQQLAAMNNKFRIYQTRNISIISFWSETKNAIMLSEMHSAGIKEIISDSKEVNLIPGIIADREIPCYILVEDNTFTNDVSISFVAQQALLEELKTAGINVISVDNYQLISNSNNLMNQIIFGLKEASTVTALAYT